MAAHDEMFDAIVIGAGHNGLVAAATLAGAGKRVCVLERAAEIGGMAKAYEIAPGVAAPRFAHLIYSLNPVVAKEIGLRLPLEPLSTISLAPDGRHVEVNGAQARFADGGAHPDAAAYADLAGRIRKFAALLAPMAVRSPPDLTHALRLAGMNETLALAKLCLKMRLMGKRDMREFMRIVLSNIYDNVLDVMGDGPLAGSLAADATLGTWSGPRSPGTVFSLMYRYGAGGAYALPAGGAASVVEAFADAARAKGAEIRTGAGVRCLVVEKDAVTGVELENGTQIAGSAVFSSAGAMASMKLAGVEHYDVEAVRRFRNIRAKGMAAKVNLLLREAPSVPGLTSEQMRSRFVVAPSALYVERAFTEAKYGEFASAPVIEAVIPTLRNDGGPHVLSAVVQFIPHGLKAGWDAAARDRLARLTIETLTSYMPGLDSLVERAHAFTPADIEAETGAPGGHWHHGELSTDQLLTVRPVNGMSRYALGPKGFYLCGAGAHPGGDVSGAPGHNSAMQALKDGVI